ncbi:MAG: hypothetical protein KME31_18440 [Tolypothrix carrinoi HA7290-LM1]|nr:hypothetical protein [Tolypothrix carrinoi HA7290-LM1]
MGPIAMGIGPDTCTGRAMPDLSSVSAIGSALDGFPNAQCPMTPDASTEGTSARHWLPHARCPMPDAQCPMPNAPCPK